MKPNPRVGATALLAGVLLIGIGFSAQTDNKGGLTAYFRLDNTSQQISDFSGFGNYSAAKGRSIKINGSSISFNGTSKLQSTLSNAPLTISFWVKNRDGGGSWETILQWTAKNSTGDTKSARVEMVGSSNDSIYTRWIAETNSCAYNGGGFWARNNNMGAPPGQWHLYTVTYDGETIKEYSNAELQDQSSPGCRLADMVSDLQFYDNIRPNVDNLRIYNRTLSQNEIEKLYSGREIDTRELVLFHRFDEGFQGCHLYYGRPCLTGDSENKITATPNSFNQGSSYEGWSTDIAKIKSGEGLLGTDSISIQPENGLNVSDLSLANHSISFWMKVSEEGRYTIFSNQSSKDLFNESEDYSGNLEDLGAQDGFSDVRLANASSNGGFEDIFTGQFYQDDFPDFAGDENYIYLKYWAKTNSVPIWEDSGRSDYDWIRKPEPNPDKYQLYILRSDGTEPSRKEYFRIYYGNNDDTSFGYYAGTELYKRNPQMQLVANEFRVYTGNYSTLDTDLAAGALKRWNNFVFRRSNGKLQLYVNGKKTDSVETPEMEISTISGFRPFSDQHSLFIDEVRIYNKTISEAEIKDLALR